MMPGYSKFQTNNAKYTKSINRNAHDPSLNATVKSSNKKESKFKRNIEKHRDLVSFFRFYPDYFLRMITPKDGKAKLTLDQIVLLRATVRSKGVYAIYSRGFGKTWIEVLATILICIFYPNSKIDLVATTKESAASILGAKFEEILRFWPILDNEIVTKNISAKNIEIVFANGSRMGILANRQSTKGTRSTKINLEESAQGDPALFADVIEPIVSEPRKVTCDYLIPNPTEPNNHNISFYTTSWYRNHPEFERARGFLEDEIDGKGKMFMSSSWHLPCFFHRGQPIEKIREIKKTTDGITFAFNYGSEWIGSHSGAVVDTAKLESLRIIEEPEFESEEDGEYYIGVDVARSTNAKNASTVAVIAKVQRKSNGRVQNVKIVNIIIIDSSLSMREQAVKIKEIKNKYNAEMIILDNNGLGVGLLDSLMDDSYDDMGNFIGCWNTINTDHEPIGEEISEDCLYAFLPQKFNNDAIVNFMSMVKGNMIHLLKKKSNIETLDALPHIQTDFLISEIDNLRLKSTSGVGGKVTVEAIKKSMPKDKYSALIYVLWYIMNYEDIATNTSTNYKSYLSALSSR